MVLEESLGISSLPSPSDWSCGKLLLLFFIWACYCLRLTTLFPSVSAEEFEKLYAAQGDRGFHMCQGPLHKHIGKK